MHEGHEKKNRRQLFDVWQKKKKKLKKGNDRFPGLAIVWGNAGHQFSGIAWSSL